jgi:ankyrin repeat protein
MKSASVLVVFLSLASFGSGCSKESDADAQARLVQAVNSKDAATVQDVLTKHPALAKAKYGEGAPLLYLALRQGGPDMLEAFLKAGADANGLGPGKDSPLSLALGGGQPNPDQVMLLLHYGAKPDQRSSLGVTPLMRAVSIPDRESASLLLGKGADANARQEGGFGSSVLHFAATGGDAGVVSMLLQKGAKPDATDSEGRTPLQVAQEAAEPQKTPEQEQAELKALAAKDPEAAVKLRARYFMARQGQAPGAGKDLTAVIAALKQASTR